MFATAEGGAVAESRLVGSTVVDSVVVDRAGEDGAVATGAFVIGVVGDGVVDEVVINALDDNGPGAMEIGALLIDVGEAGDDGLGGNVVIPIADIRPDKQLRMWEEDWRKQYYRRPSTS